MKTDSYKICSYKPCNKQYVMYNGLYIFYKSQRLLIFDNKNDVLYYIPDTRTENNQLFPLKLKTYI